MDRQRQQIRLTLSPQAQRYVQKDAPLEVRRMAAAGALPLPPSELATVLFALLHDSDTEVKDRAKASLEGLPEGVCEAVLTGETHPAVLSYLARAHRDHEGHLEKIALNPHSDDATIAFLATFPHKRLIDIISNNQERMLRASEIVDALGANPLIGRSVIDRILSFLGVSPDQEEDDEFGNLAELSEQQTEAALRAVLGEEFGELAQRFAQDTDSELEDDAVSSNLYGAIQKMTVVQKVKLARMGNKEARALLVRDRNKIVACAVISSPKLSDNEVLSFAQSKNVADEILRVISANREWTRNYQVKLALVANPKCPQPAAMKFLNYLQDRHLLMMMRSRDVPAAISTHARRILSKKGKI